jgi:cell division protein FtsB
VAPPRAKQGRAVRAKGTKRAADPKVAPTPPAPASSTRKRGAGPAKASTPRRHAKRPAGAKRPASPKVRRRRTVVVGLLFALLLLGFLFAFVYPTRTYLKQRDQIQAAEERLGILQQETRALRNDTKLLEGDAEVERIAREQYGLVRPGETPYVLVPTTTPPAK